MTKCWGFVDGICRVCHEDSHNGWKILKFSPSETLHTAFPRCLQASACQVQLHKIKAPFRKTQLICQVRVQNCRLKCSFLQLKGSIRFFMKRFDKACKFVALITHHPWFVLCKEVLIIPYDAWHNQEPLNDGTLEKKLFSK